MLTAVLASVLAAVVVVHLGLGTPAAAEEVRSATWTCIRPATSVQEAWLERVNALRSAAGLPALREDPAWSAAAREHARYMVRNQELGHSQDPSLPAASPDGAWAARAGNVYLDSCESPPTHAIHSWLASPGHAAWLLEPQLTTIGYGDHTDHSRSPYGHGAVLPVVDGLDRSVPVADRITFPGDGATVRTYPSEGPSGWIRTLALRRADLDPFAGEWEARVTVDGQPRPGMMVMRARDWVVIVLDHPLPSDAEVAVVVLKDGRYDDRWTFRTSSTTTVPPPAGQQRTPALWDVSGTTHATAISALADAGLLGGYRDGSFRPATAVTRGQFASLLTAALQLEPSPGAAGDLSDVAGSAHADGIHALVAAGLASGYEDGRFRPNHQVTRGQLATVLTAALALPAPGPVVVTGLHDLDGSVHRAGIEAAVAAGFAEGYPDGTFRPDDAVQRGQLATVVARATGRG